MSLPLFREEALQARRHSWLGEVVLDQKPSARLLAGGLVLACAGIVLLLAFGDYTRRTRVAGQLVPTLGMATVVAPVSGVVAELAVQEGQRMLPGQSAMQVLVPGATRASGNTLVSLERSLLARRTSVRSGYRAQRQRLDARAAGLEQQQALASAELEQIGAELATRERQYALAQQTLEKFRRMHSTRYVSDLQLQQQESQVLELLGAVQGLQRQRLAVQQKRAQLAQALHEVPQERAAADAAEARELSVLAQEQTELQARGESVVTAPMAGAVGVLFVHAGQTVQAGQPLLALLPASSQLEAHLAVPGAAIGFVAPGDTVLLRYAAYPYQKFGQHRGRVLRISRNALAANEAGSAPAYRVIVALERQSVRAGDRDWALRPGLVLEADILGERRKLWEWLVEPLQTLRGQLSGQGDLPSRGSVDGAAPAGDSAPPVSVDRWLSTTRFHQAPSWRGSRAGTGSDDGFAVVRDRRATPLNPTRVGRVCWFRPRSAGLQRGLCHA